MHLNNYHFYSSKNYLYGKPVKGLRGYGLSYGFAFNGKERDNETYGEGNTYDFGARMLDVRLGGHFFSIDPFIKKYPFWTPYSFATNNPIKFIDKDGNGPIDPRTWERTSSFLMIWNEVSIFRIYEKSNTKTAVDKSLYYWAGAIEWGAAEPMGRFGEDFSTEGRNPKQKIAGGFINRIGEKEPNAEYKDRLVGGRDAYNTAALEGNYDFKNTEGDSKFSITSVTDGIITQVYNYEKNSSNVFEITSSTSFNISYSTVTTKVNQDGYMLNLETQIAKVTETTKNYKTGKTESKSYEHSVSAVVTKIDDKPIAPIIKK
jgi:RHS repeat-associated protein